MDSAAMIDMLGGWLEAYPIASVEDPLGEDDVDGTIEFTRRFGERVGVGAGLSAQTIRDYSREYDYQYYCGVSESGTQLECEDEPKAFATELVVNPQLRLHVKANDVIAFDAQVWTQVATASAWSTGTVPGGASVGMTVHYGWEDQPKTSAHREHSSAFSSAQ